MGLGMCANCLSQGVSRSEILPGESFVYNGDRRRLRGVAIGEVAPGNKLDLHRPEIAGAYPSELGAAFYAAGANIQRKKAAVQRNMRGGRRRFHHRDGSNLPQELIFKSFVTLGRQLEAPEVQIGA